MSKVPNTKMIGLFTLTGIILFLGAIVIFLGDKLFVKDKDLVVTFFDESIKGLSIGSPVVLKGVELGKVYKIDLLADTDDLSFKIPVFIKFHAKDIVKLRGKKASAGIEKDIIEKLVDKGLRARLASQNFLTGQLMIELDFDNSEPPVYKGDGSHQEIPTILSSIGELSKGLQDLPIRDSIVKFNGLLEQMTKLTMDLNKILGSSGSQAASAFDNMNKTIQDIGEAAQSLRNFADYIERHPEALLKGKSGGY